MRAARLCNPVPGIAAMLFATFAAFPSSYARAASAAVDMHPSAWQADGGAALAFSQPTDMTGGVLTVKHGGAILRDTTFSDGTIEFDVREEAGNEGIPGVWFRRRDAQVAENVYLRPDSPCPQSIECIQYAPVSHGNVQWDVYPEYQAAAPVHATGWNHVRLVVSGQRMNVFVNGEATPSLIVALLEGDARQGGVELWGDAAYANVKIAPGAVDGLDPHPLPDPAQNDPTYLRQWQLAPIGQLARGQTVSLSDEPAAPQTWPKLVAERKGFVNLGRNNGTTRGTPDLAWLHTSVDADHEQVRRISLGWAREIWIFVNGKPVFVGTNHYYPATVRKAPLGRMALGNDTFDLPLRAGRNDIEVALSDDLPSTRHWGWGFIWKFDQVDGLQLPPVSSGM